MRFAWLAAVLGTGTLAFFGTGLRPIWPLLWLAPIPVLVVSTRLPGRTAALVAFAAWFLGQTNLAGYLFPVLPPLVALTILALPAVAFVASVVMYRAGDLRGSPLPAILGFASVWTSFELGLVLASPHGSFGSLAYTQVEALPVIQLVSVTGVLGVSFLVLLTSATLAQALSRRSLPAGVIGIWLTALLSSLAYGAVRLAGVFEPAGRIPVAAVSLDSTTNFFGSPRPEVVSAVVRSFETVVAAAARAGARVVVLPEKFVTTTAAQLARTEAQLAELAGRHRVILVAGVNLLDAPNRNLALTITPDGTIAGRYEKIRLIPGLEAGYAKGKEPGLVTSTDPGFGVAICKDLDFPRDIRRYARARVPFLAVPAWDFIADGPLHARMAVVRGIEGGYSIVRAAHKGWVSISDPYGRMQWRATLPRESVMVAGTIPATAIPTLYEEAGDWFGLVPPLTVLLSIAHLLRPIGRGRRRP
jgi:apolipoprotein N-acyltransferase